MTPYGLQILVGLGCHQGWEMVKLGDTCAGGNLGIVTSFTVKLNSLDDVPVVTVGRLSWGYEHAVDVFDKVRSPLMSWTFVLRVHYP